MDQEKIGKFIKEIRIKNNLTQKDLAEKYGVTYQAVSKWENGKNIPDIALLKQMSQDFNINIEDILNGTYTKKKKNKREVRKRFPWIDPQHPYKVTGAGEPACSQCKSPVGPAYPPSLVKCGDLTFRALLHSQVCKEGSWRVLGSSLQLTQTVSTGRVLESHYIYMQ